MAEPSPAPPPPIVERVRVPGDVAAAIIRSVDGAPPTTVFVPGLCSNTAAYLMAFASAAQKQGGVVGVEGDAPCGQGVQGFHSFSWDAGRLHARVEAALAAGGLREIPRGGITLVGYSQGAALAEQLVQRWPERYARVVIMGAPTDPSVPKLARARGVVTMSCSRDVPVRMRDAATRLGRAGVPATYIEMPGCVHGQLADGDRVFDEVFDFLRSRALAESDATAVPLVGLVGDEIAQ